MEMKSLHYNGAESFRLNNLECVWVSPHCQCSIVRGTGLRVVVPVFRVKNLCVLFSACLVELLSFLV
jgi:hypothetical protein